MRKDNTLLRLLHERSEQALPELTKVYGGLCRSIAENILSSREDVEETVSDAMLAVWNRVPPEQPENMSVLFTYMHHNQQKRFWPHQKVHKMYIHRNRSSCHEHNYRYVQNL